MIWYWYICYHHFNVQIFETPSLLGRAHSSAKLQRESLRKPAERSSGFVLRGSCDPKQRKKTKVKKRHIFLAHRIWFGGEMTSWHSQIIKTPGINSTWNHLNHVLLPNGSPFNGFVESTHASKMRRRMMVGPMSSNSCEHLPFCHEICHVREAWLYIQRWIYYKTLQIFETHDPSNIFLRMIFAYAVLRPCLGNSMQELLHNH